MAANETAVSETDIVLSSDDNVVFRQESSAGATFFVEVLEFTVYEYHGGENDYIFGFFNMDLKLR